MFDLTPEEELFCLEYLNSGKNAMVAFLKAFPKKVRDFDMTTHAVKVEAGVLLDNPHIFGRIVELHDRTAEYLTLSPGSVTEDFLTRKILKAMAIDELRNNSSGIRQSAMDLGKLKGLIVDKSDVTSKHHFTVMDNVTINGDPLSFDVGTPVSPPNKIIDITPTTSPQHTTTDGEDLI